MPTLGNRIRHLRVKSGLSIGSLEKILGLNNIQKYACATQVHIQFKRASNDLRMEIQT